MCVFIAVNISSGVLPKIRLLGKHPVLEPTREADEVERRNKSGGRAGVRAKEVEVVDREARKRVLAAGGEITQENISSQMEIQFGQYRQQTFRWV